MSLEIFTTSDIATAICRSCNKNEQFRLQALLLVKNGLSPAKVAEDFSVHRSTVALFKMVTISPSLMIPLIIPIVPMIICSETFPLQKDPWNESYLL